MLSAMARSFPPEAAWTPPAGGLFIWVRLPASVDATALLKDALAEKVAFVPGHAFHADGSGHNTMRLNFTGTTEAQIDEGIARLGRVVARAVCLVP
jgi:DNA-binding transcriptional MocR family regulator